MTGQPPLGIVPKWRHEELVSLGRAVELLDAMRRYLTNNRGHEIPEVWMVEYASCINKLRRNRKPEKDS